MKKLSPRCARLAVLLALAWAGPCRSASADREAAGFFVQRGDRAVKEKNWDEAEKQYRKALEEDEHFLPARLGLGEALLGTGNRTGAIEEWRRLVTEGQAMTPLPAGWGDSLVKAKKRLADVDEAGTALAGIVDQQVDALLALATKWLARDADVASRALQEVLRIRPGNEKALALVEKATGAGGGWKPQFDGKDFAGFTGMSKEWDVVDGALVCDGKDGAYALKTDASFTGDFDVRMEAKMAAKYDGPMLYGLAATGKGFDEWALFGIHTNALVLRDENGPSIAARELFAAAPKDMKPPFDPTEWTLYEMHFRGDDIELRVNNIAVATRPRPKERDGGNLGVKVQNVKLVIRKFEARKK